MIVHSGQVGFVSKEAQEQKWLLPACLYITVGLIPPAGRTVLILQLQRAKSPDRSALIGRQTAVNGPLTSKYKAVAISSFITSVEHLQKTLVSCATVALTETSIKCGDAACKQSYSMILNEIYIPLSPILNF